MFIYVADEQAVYTGEFSSAYRVYRLIRKIADVPTVGEAVAEYGQVTYWRTAAGRIR